MDLFSDFSFSKPSSRQCDQFSELAPVDQASPRSSRSASPCAPNSPPSTRQYQPSVQYIDSIEYTDPYNLDLDPLVARSAPRKSSRPLGMDRRRNTPPRDYFDMTRSRRQSAVRQQCDPRRASAIRSYVERLLREGQGTISEMHPSSLHQSCPTSVTSAPARDSYGAEEIPSPGSSSTDEDEMEDFKYLAISENSASSSRRGSSIISSRRNHAVRRSVRARPKSRGQY